MLQPTFNRGEANIIDEDDNQTGLRRRSSQIISADPSLKEGPQQGRDREDSITAFKKFEKSVMQDQQQYI